jgi:hypothetical protein
MTPAAHAAVVGPDPADSASPKRTEGRPQEFTFTATLTGVQQAAVTDLARHDLGVLAAPPGAERP